MKVTLGLYTRAGQLTVEAETPEEIVSANATLKPLVAALRRESKKLEAAEVPDSALGNSSI